MEAGLEQEMLLSSLKGTNPDLCHRWLSDTKVELPIQKHMEQAMERLHTNT